MEDLARALAPFASPEHAVLVPPALARAPSPPEIVAHHARQLAAQDARTAPESPTSERDHEPAPRALTRTSRRPHVVVVVSLFMLSGGAWALRWSGLLGGMRAPVGSSALAANATVDRVQTVAGAKLGTDNFCSGHELVAEGIDPLIDDVEDGDILIRPVEHRTGYWWTFDDKTCSHSPAVAQAEAPGGRNPSRFAMHVGAHDCFTYGFGIVLTLNRVSIFNCAYDASRYDGVYFWARSGQSPVTALFEVATRQTEPLSFGGDGSCEPHCWDTHSVYVELTPVWKQYSAYWTDLRQRGFGEKPVPFDAKQIAAIHLSTSATPRNFREIWIDQVAFFKGAAPPSPFPDESRR